MTKDDFVKADDACNLYSFWLVTAFFYDKILRSQLLLRENIDIIGHSR